MISSPAIDTTANSRAAACYDQKGPSERRALMLHQTHCSSERAPRGIKRGWKRLDGHPLSLVVREGIWSCVRNS